jgi:S-formylglutathione hydrolase FrmB
MDVMNFTPILLTTLLLQPSTLPVEVSFAKSVTSEPFTGRVFIMATKAPSKGRPAGLNWFNPAPCFAQDVANWMPDTPLKFEPKFAHPKTWDALAKEKYYLQAVLDRDLGGISCFTSPGNAYSKPVLHDPEKPTPLKLVIDTVIAERKFEEKGRVKYVEIESKLLTEFHKKPIKLRAGVVVPKSFAAGEGSKKYPIIYEIPGFGGDHFFAFNSEGRTEVAGVEMLYVVLDPNCRLGHHVFADSDNNGPYGKALTEELIPFIESKFRSIGTPGTRFVTGHSSGGWSSLWLQVTYPDFFGGVWSTAPDPVDFRDFQRVNIYDPKQNLFNDDKGEPRPLARKGDKVLLRYKPFNDMEVVMGRGGQLQSFEAVFSPRGKDGNPMPLWNRTTGVIDQDIAKAWQRYDIRLILQRDWKTLDPKLAGKLHVYMGDDDTFYLDGATRLLRDSQKKLGSDAVIEMFPGKDHGNLVDMALRKRIAIEMVSRLRLGKER